MATRSEHIQYINGEFKDSTMSKGNTFLELLQWQEIKAIDKTSCGKTLVRMAITGKSSENGRRNGQVLEKTAY